MNSKKDNKAMDVLLLEFSNLPYPGRVMWELTSHTPKDFKITSYCIGKQEELPSELVNNKELKQGIYYFYYKERSERVNVIYGYNNMFVLVSIIDDIPTTILISGKQLLQCKITNQYLRALGAFCDYTICKVPRKDCLSTKVLIYKWKLLHSKKAMTKLQSLINLAIDIPALLLTNLLRTGK